MRLLACLLAFGDSLVAPVALDVVASSMNATIASVVPVVPPVSTPLAGSSFSLPAVPDPAFLATVVKAVKVTLASEQTTGSTQIAGLASFSPTQTSVPEGVPSQDLVDHRETFLASGTGFPLSLPYTLPSASQGTVPTESNYP